MEPRYADIPGDPVLPLAAHVKYALAAVREGRATPEEALTSIALNAYRAGHREGESAYAAVMAQIMRDRVARAVASIVVAPAVCPHCAGRGCDECGDSGKRRGP